ncbi:MAG TPA: hypothetical protein DCS91_04610 [Microcoleaceae bacterium UBA11344]|nr:hypothetical protein [Microcoleaceae cyanobacterium UBA11344]
MFIYTVAKYIPTSMQQNQVKLLATKRPECNFSNANLKNANLNRANLTGADLGCAGISFNLDANNQGANMDFKVSAVSENNHPENAVVGFNIKATDRGATMRSNQPGCAEFDQARLQETKMPDGKINP